MQNFGMQGANQSAQSGGGQMYGAGGVASLIGPGPPIPQVVSHIPVQVQMNTFKVGILDSLTILLIDLPFV